MGKRERKRERRGGERERKGEREGGGRFRMRERRNAMCKSGINGTRNRNRFKRQEKA